MNDHCKRMGLVDMISKLQDCIQKFLPFAWVAFAIDVAELCGHSHKFVEGTDEAGMQ